MRRTSILALALGAAATPALACEPRLVVSHEEAAPRDYLRIVNESVGDWPLVSLRVDLGPSAGALVVDTVTGGPGAGSAKPFQFAAGAPPSVAPAIPDGASRFTLAFAGVGPGQSSVFTLDLDDTRAPSGLQTRVSFAEIEGAQVTAHFNGPNGASITLDGAFGPDGAAILEPAACV